MLITSDTGIGSGYLITRKYVYEDLIGKEMLWGKVVDRIASGRCCVAICGSHTETGNDNNAFMAYGDLTRG